MRCVAADEGHLRVQGLREDGRLRALARVGICSTTKAPDGKPWGEQRIVALVKDWVVTWRDELISGTEGGTNTCHLQESYVQET